MIAATEMLLDAYQHQLTVTHTAFQYKLQAARQECCNFTRQITPGKLIGVPLPCMLSCCCSVLTSTTFLAMPVQANAAVTYIRDPFNFMLTASIATKKNVDAVVNPVLPKCFGISCACTLHKKRLHMHPSVCTSVQSCNRTPVEVRSCYISTCVLLHLKQAVLATRHLLPPNAAEGLPALVPMLQDP